MKSAHRISGCIIAGDMNLHFPFLVHHDVGCRCAHCKPSTLERSVASRLASLGMVCHNPPDVCTHVSGSIIDLIWSDSTTFFDTLQVFTPGSVAASDHALVYGRPSLQVSSRFQTGFGRVWWTSSAEWDSALLAIDDSLRDLAYLVRDLYVHPSVMALAETSSCVRQRRALLDAVMWIRDAWYTFSGHLAGAVASRRHAGTTSNSLPATVANAWHGDAAVDFKGAVNDFEWNRKRQIISRFAALKESDPGYADRFLSHILKPREQLQVALRDEFGNIMDTLALSEVQN